MMCYAMQRGDGVETVIAVRAYFHVSDGEIAQLCRHMIHGGEQDEPLEFVRRTMTDVLNNQLVEVQ